MAEITSEEIRIYLNKVQGQTLSLNQLRSEFQVVPGSKSFDNIRTIMWRLADEKIVTPIRGKHGVYKVVKQVKPIQIFGVERERKPPYDLVFPKDFDTGMQLPFAEQIVVRSGDNILIGGQSNYGKTTLAMNFAGENIDTNPVLMGNEYAKDDEPTQRFLNRLDTMDWVEWQNDDGKDKFTLLPVSEDYAEHIVKGKINIIDWINLPGEYYMISPLMEAIRKAIGDGIAIIVLQKNEGVDYARGGALTKDFADVELLIDKHTHLESRITVGKVKESTSYVTGRSWAFGISKGVKLLNVREVTKCPTCHGFKYIKGKGACDTCDAVGWLDK